jgi:transportin-1
MGYLAHILTVSTNEDDRVRMLAGSLLKTNIKSNFRKSSPWSSQQDIDYVKIAVLRALCDGLCDSTILVRYAASQAICAIFRRSSLRSWPECLQQLLGYLDSEELACQEVRIPTSCFSRSSRFAKLDYLLFSFLS